MVSLVDPAELAKPLAEQHWTTVVEHSDDVRVNGAGVTSTHLIVSVRKDTIERVQVMGLSGLGTPAQEAPVEPAFDEELYTAGVGGSDYEAPVIRLGYTSYFTPSRVYDFVLPTAGTARRRAAAAQGKPGAGRLLRRPTTWPRGNGPTAADGTRIPLSVLRHKRIKQDSTAAGLVYGYGSYELSMDPGFGIARLSLLDRGVVFVIAHIRGGGELGRHWYEDGKKLTKKNTFTDFIAATDWLADSGWVAPARIAAMGGSAGGLLMGAVANLAPEKYAAMVAQVPFVDPLTTILDPELPLSALEWEEWGNPITDPEVYAYMNSYSPYENVRRGGLPEDRRGDVLQRHPRPLRGARQVGPGAAEQDHRHGADRDEDRNGRRPRRRVRPVRPVARAGVGLRLHRRLPGRGGAASGGRAEIGRSVPSDTQNPWRDRYSGSARDFARRRRFCGSTDLAGLDHRDRLRHSSARIA